MQARGLPYEVDIYIRVEIKERIVQATLYRKQCNVSFTLEG